MGLQVEGLALTLLVVVLVFLVVSWIVVSLRLWVRVWIKGIGIDDYFMTAGLWFTLFQLFYALSAIFIKCAVCLSLLRITNRPRYRWPVYIAMFLATLSTTIGFFTILAWCRPISANWDPSAGKCANATIVTNISFFISASAILTDWTCAILPAFILWEIQLNRRTKMTVMFVLALGVVASISTIVRLKYLLAYTNVSDYLYGVANIALWSIVELGSGLIAGSMATLRPLFKFIPFMRSSRNRSGADPSATPGYGSRSHKLETFGTRGPHSRYRTLNEGTKSEEERGGSDGDSQKHILKETEVTVITDEIGTAQQVGHTVPPTFSISIK
ncbi:putative cation-transporting atpase 4 [Phaeomoniella chlamydospora]|uniref:Putative cation-transporting atpase 4 n=1 Tax=Phaeomoniella chlamydospora TaxID=158046 RepID=A0A0G2EWH0_PHACM|nr:putative cation-transporting atpase 4 [Phaeomoniella chlamydospora]